MANKLKPCGHCNNKAELMVGESGLGGEVKCTECWMRTGWYEDPADAIYIWNRRDGEGTILCEHEYQPGFFIILSTREEVSHERNKDTE